MQSHTWLGSVPKVWVGNVSPFKLLTTSLSPLFLTATTVSCHWMSSTGVILPNRNGPISFVSHSMHRQKPVTGMQRRGDAKQSVKQGLHLLNCHWDDTIALIVNVFTCERDAGGCALAVLDAQQINTGCCLLTNWSSIKWFTNGICKSGPAWKQFIKMVQHGSSSNLLTTSLPMRLTRPARHGTQSQSSGIQLCTGEALRVVYLHQPGARAYNSGSAPKFLLNVLCSSL